MSIHLYVPRNQTSVFFYFFLVKTSLFICLKNWKYAGQCYSRSSSNLRRRSGCILANPFKDYWGSKRSYFLVSHSFLQMMHFLEYKIESGPCVFFPIDLGLFSCYNYFDHPVVAELNSYTPVFTKNRSRDLNVEVEFLFLYLDKSFGEEFFFFSFFFSLLRLFCYRYFFGFSIICLGMEIALELWCLERWITQDWIFFMLWD